jgi:hypothetical protein
MAILTFDPDSFALSNAAGAVAKGLSVEEAWAEMVTLCEGANGTPMRFSLVELLGMYVEIFRSECSPPPCLWM